MKTTQYFRYTRERPDRAMIKDEWIERAIQNPLKEEVCSLMVGFENGRASLKWKTVCYV